MKKSTRIILIILCSILIALSVAGVIWSFVNKFTQEAHAEEIEENTQTTFVNFNQYIQNSYINYTTNSYYANTLPVGIYYMSINSNVNTRILFVYSGGSYYAKSINEGKNDFLFTFNNQINAIQFDNAITYTNFNAINLTQMYGSETANTITLAQCQQLFRADYYPYNEGTTIDLSGFEQYNAGAMSVRESMTINTTSANVADNLDNVVINSSYGSVSKALIQGYMVWGAGDYANCVALFNLETNFNEGDYFEFEFYTITGADSANGLPNINTFYDLQIIAVNSSGNIVPLATVKAQNNPNATTKATFYLPFSTNKLYITTPHKYIIGYNNFKINITTTNLTALSLYSYKDGFREGRSSGYTSGYNAGIAQQNATLGTMEYIGAAFNGIGSILQIELLPNVPLSLFILLPLMFGLITFVVKLSKGGS